MKKIISVILGLVILLNSASFVLAEESATSTSSTDDALIQQLLEQIEILKAQIEVVKAKIETLTQARNALRDSKKEVKTTLKIIKNLSRGMTGDDVALLQEALATDPEIYPEGLVTGYFGNLTEKAVKRFQNKMGVEQVGIVGPKTTSKLNELLAEGAGNSGKVPPGLLVAPGIIKKLGYTPEALPGQKLPPGIAKKLGGDNGSDDDDGDDDDDDQDITPPVISDLTSTSTSASSTRITWVTDELADSKVYYSTSTPVETTATTPSVNDDSLTLNHNLSINELNASTTYYYLVVSEDEAGNSATSTEQSFDTLNE